MSSCAPVGSDPLWEEYRQANPEGYRYSSFRELYERWRSKLDVKANTSCTIELPASLRSDELFGILIQREIAALHV